MPEHTIGTREEWQAARDELAKLEAEQAERNEEIKRKRLALPWVPVEKEYEFDTEDGKKTLAELFDGRSQLLAYNVMFGPDYTLGACPGCTSLADGLDGSLVHLNHRDVTLICFSRAPIERLTAYKQRMGWEFPYVSTYNTDFAFDFGLAMTEEQAQGIPEVKDMVDNPPEWLEEWSGQIGADLKDGLRENPSWIAFARENGTVYHTYTVSAPDPFVAPYFSFLEERTPKPGPVEPRHLAEGRVPGLTPAPRAAEPAPLSHEPPSGCSGPPAAGKRLADPNAEAVDQLRHRLGLHLEPVALRELGHRLLARADHTAHRVELGEEALEAGRRDDLEDPARLVSGVPERVPLVARLEDEVPRPGLDHVVAEQRTHPPLEDEAVLVLARVAVHRRRERARRHRVLDEREAPPASSPSIMKRTPMLPRKPALPSAGPTIFTALLSCMSESFH